MAMATSNLLFVTGASRGLGQAIAVAFARAFRETSKTTPSQSASSTTTAVLLARSCSRETKQQMLRENKDMNIDQHSVDLANLETLESSVMPILEHYRDAFNNIVTTTEPATTKFRRAILINCAGTTGTVGPTSHLSLADIQQAIHLNLISKIWLSAQFARLFEEKHYNNDNADHDMENSTSTVQTQKESTVIVNISSMCSVKPTPTMALYCATNAGRDMFHQVLAQDTPPTTNVKVWNYAPGSCDTDMQTYLRRHSNLDPAVQQYCRSLPLTGGLVNPNDTATALVQRVLEDDFESGDRFEYTCASSYKY